MKRIPEIEVIGQMVDAQHFNQVMGKSMVQHEYQRLAQTLLKMGLPEGCRVLDVRTGTGYLALEVATYLQGHGQVVSLDLSEAMLNLAAENALSRRLEDYTAWKLGDASAMPFSDRISEDLLDLMIIKE